MNIQARRVFRLALTTAVALTIAYALGGLFAFMAPLFAFLMALKPAPPTGARGLMLVVLVIALTTGSGLLLVPLLMHFPATGLLVVALGLYFGTILTLNLRQAALGLFVALGVTLISATGLYNFTMGRTLVEALISGMVIAIISHWLVYPFFPEDPSGKKSVSPPPAADTDTTGWIAIRSTLIVLPVYFMALNNPSLYMAAIMKSVSLGQQASELDAAHAGRELLGSTFLAGIHAMLFWVGLSILPNLWMFFLWTLLFGIYVGGKIYGLLPTGYSASFWVNVMTTLLILIGPAVADVSSGKDVYMASFIRLSLFVVVSLYAWWTLSLLDAWRRRRLANHTRAEAV